MFQSNSRPTGCAEIGLAQKRGEIPPQSKSLEQGSDKFEEIESV